MGEGLERLSEELELRRTRGGMPECLSDAVLEGLADGSLPPSQAAGAREHLETCLECLHAYATLRSLLDASLPAAVAAEPRDRRRGLAESIRRTLSRRLAVGWTVATAAAAVLVTWTLATHLERGPATSEGPRGLAGPPVPAVTELAERPRAVSGLVEQIRDASAGSVTAHVLDVKDAAGDVYTVFVWGPPTVPVGARIVVEGFFSPLGGAGGGPRYKGVATLVRGPGSR